MQTPTFFDVLYGEALKTKGTWGLTLSLLGPMGVTALIVLYSIKESQHLEASTSNLWFQLGRYHFNFFFLLYPLFTALIAFLISNVEHRAKGFKQLFVLPAPKFYFYFSKWLLLMGWLAASLLLATGLVYGSGYFLELLFPSSPFDQFAPDNALWLFMRNLGIALLAVLAIHYFLSIYFDNFIISIGAACFLLITGMVGTSWEYGHWIPYTYFSRLFIEYVSSGEGIMFGTREMWISLGYVLLFFAGGYWLFARKEVKAG